jgi:universal stress protein E
MAMNMPSSILVVVERTEGASDLIKKALEIARRFGARVELFLCEAEQAYELAHAYDREGIQEARAESIAKARDYLSHLKACIDATDIEITIDAVCESPLYEAVVRKVLHSTPDLVIKGLAAVHARQHRTADPNDWQLMRTCPATLMLTRRGAWHVPPRFAAAVDVSEQETPSLPQNVMQAASMLVLPWQASLDVLYGESGTSDVAVSSHADNLRSLCDAHGVTPDRTHVLYGPAEESLAPFAQEQDFDVLVLGALTHRPAGTVLVGTLTSKLLDALDCDFVLVKSSSYRCPIEEGHEAAARGTPAKGGTLASFD